MLVALLLLSRAAIGSQQHPAWWFQRFYARAQLTVEGCLPELEQRLRTPAVFTIAAGEYGSLLRRWSHRMESLGWLMRFVAALDSPTYGWRTATSSAEKSCFVPMFVQDEGARTNTSGGVVDRFRQRIPKLVGVAKFTMFALLLRAGMKVVVLSELDVVWMADPWPLLDPALSTAASDAGRAAARQVSDPDRDRIVVLGMENYPWDLDLNLGFIVVRNSAAARGFFRYLSNDWSAKVHEQPLLGWTVARDQMYMSMQLRHRSRTVVCVRLNRTQFALPNVFQRNHNRAVFNAHLSAKGDDGSPFSGWSSRQFRMINRNSRPLLHLRHHLVVLHVTGCSGQHKWLMLRLLWDAAVAPSVGTLCNATWYELVAKGAALAGVTQDADYNASEVLRTWNRGLPRAELAQPASSGLTERRGRRIEWSRVLRAPTELAERHAERPLGGASEEDSAVSDLPGAAGRLANDIPALRRGDLYIHSEFLNVSELALLRAHLMNVRPGSLLDRVLERRDTYAMGKRLLDMGQKRVRKLLPQNLVGAVSAAFDRAHKMAQSLKYTSEAFDAKRQTIGNAQHISWHQTGSDFPPHVDFAPNCVAILLYLTDGGGVDFEGGELQTRGCPTLWQCPLSRREYNLSISARLACRVATTHVPHAGQLVVFLAETAHAVKLVTSGTRIALNSWLNCPLAKPFPPSRARSALKACVAKVQSRPLSSTTPPPLPRSNVGDHDGVGGDDSGVHG